MRARLIVGLVFVIATCAGCGTSKAARFYTLDALSTSSNLPSTNVSVAVGPISVPASVDRPEFVVQVAANRVQVDEFNRWAGPLGDSIARAVAGDLATLLGTPDVASGPLANFKPTYRVTIDVQRFDSVVGKQVLLDAVWVVNRTADGSARSGRTTATETVQGDNYDALAAAHSRAIAQMSGDIAAAIRAEEAARSNSQSSSKR